MTINDLKTSIKELLKTGGASPFPVLYCIDNCFEQIFTKGRQSIILLLFSQLVMKTFTGTGRVNKVLGWNVQFTDSGVNTSF